MISLMMMIPANVGKYNPKEIQNIINDLKKSAEKIKELVSNLLKSGGKNIAKGLVLVPQMIRSTIHYLYAIIICKESKKKNILIFEI